VCTVMIVLFAVNNQHCLWSCWKERSSYTRYGNSSPLGWN